MKKGNTLIELLIYISLISGIAISSVLYVTNLVSGRVKSVLQENISHNARLATRRLAYEIRHAKSIISSSNTELCLETNDSSRNPIKISLNSGRLFLGWGGNCNSNSQAYPLTSSDVMVSDLSFRTYSDATSSIIDYSFKISGNNVVGRQEWIYDTTASGSATLR